MELCTVCGRPGFGSVCSQECLDAYNANNANR